MGGGTSSLPSLRETLLAQAYDSRASPDQSLFESFLSFATQREDSAYYITVPRIKEFLGMQASWLDDFLVEMFVDREHMPSGEAEINLCDFVNYLENGEISSFLWSMATQASPLQHLLSPSGRHNTKPVQPARVVAPSRVTDPSQSKPLPMPKINDVTLSSVNRNAPSRGVHSSQPKPRLTPTPKTNDVDTKAQPQPAANREPPQDPRPRTAPKHNDDVHVTRPPARVEPRDSDDAKIAQPAARVEPRDSDDAKTAQPVARVEPRDSDDAKTAQPAARVEPRDSDDAKTAQSAVRAELHKILSHTGDVNRTNAPQSAREEGERFVDLDFKPNNSSLGDMSFVQKIRNGDVVFKRPEEFLSTSTSASVEGNDDVGFAVLERGISVDDISQGQLGDCWFISALAALCEFPELVKNLFLPDSRDFSLDGEYFIRFCIGGRWTTVRVDDYFPCSRHFGPVFTRPIGRKLWVMLVEKAYAKVHGSYAALHGGIALNAFLDLTGAPSRRFGFGDEPVKQMIASGQLWKDLVNYDRMKFPLGASTFDQYDNVCGLVGGHGYTLIACAEVKGHKLVCLRNPWGQGEWNGDWSDNSELWTQDMKRALGFENKNNGTFWMSFADFTKFFESVTVCCVRNPAYSSTPWHEIRGSFFFDIECSPEDTACEHFRVRSAVFSLSVFSPGKFVFSLHQMDLRVPGSKAYIDTGLAVLRVDSDGYPQQLVVGLENSADRGNHSPEIDLEPGEYLIVPFSSGGQLRREVEESKRKKLTNAGDEKRERAPLFRKDTDGDVEFSDKVIRAFELLFIRIDSDSDGVVNKAELDTFMIQTEGGAMDDNTFSELLNSFETPENAALGVLSCNSFIASQLHRFRQSDCNEDILWKEFAKWGFDDKLQLCGGRPVTLAVHATSDSYSMRRVFMDELPLVDKAREMMIVQYGKKKPFADGKATFYSYFGGVSSCSLLVENHHSQTLHMTVDCSKSDNVISHRGSLVHTEDVQPHERVVFHHLIPRETLSTWKMSHTWTYRFGDDMAQLLALKAML